MPDVEFEIPWLEDKLLWWSWPQNGFIVASREKPGDILFECTHEMWEPRPWGSERPIRCDAVKENRRQVCPLWAGHDGPHIPCNEELFRHMGGFTITGLRRP